MVWGVCVATSLQVSAQILDVPVATVKLTKLENISQKTLKEKAQLLQTQLGRTLTRSEKEDLLDSEIATILLQQAANRDRISAPREEINRFVQLQKEQLGVAISDSDFRALIEKETGVSYKEYEDQIKNRLIIERYIFQKSPALSGQANFSPSNEEIVAFYEENATRFAAPALARFTHLYIDTRNLSDSEMQAGKKKINELRRNISTGKATFDTLVKESLDDPEYGGGDFGYIARGEEKQRAALGQEFVNSVFLLKEDDVSAVLESNVGYHIIKITDKRSPRLLTISDPVFPGERVTVRDQIVQYLTYEDQQKKFQTALQSQVELLKKDAEIRIFSQNLDWDE